MKIDVAKFVYVRSFGLYNLFLICDIHVVEYH